MLLDLALDDGTFERKHVLVQFVVLLLVQVKQVKQLSQHVLVQFVRVLLMPVKACQKLAERGERKLQEHAEHEAPRALQQALPC